MLPTKIFDLAKTTSNWTNKDQTRIRIAEDRCRKRGYHAFRYRFQIQICNEPEHGLELMELILNLDFDLNLT